MANTRSCRPKRYAAQRAQTFFSQEQTSALFYKEQDDLKKALRRSLLEARRVASRAETPVIESDTKFENGVCDVKESDHSDHSDQSRPKRFAAQKAQVLFSQEQTSALFYKEQNDIKKAVKKSLIEAKRAASRADKIESKYVNGDYKSDKSRSEDSESHENPEDDRHSNKDSQSNDSTSSSSSKSKKLKVHAQRKFASSVNNSPVKSDPKSFNETVDELFPRNRLSTEDFLTLLCFRSTKLTTQINGNYDKDNDNTD